MKKFFLFVAAIATAMTVNAKVYDFSTITIDDVETTLEVTTEIKDGEATGKLLIAVPGDQAVYEVILFEDIKLHYSSKDAKNIVVDTKNGYFEFPGNGATVDGKALVTIEGLAVDDDVTLEVANKGTGDVSVVAIDGCTGDAVSLPKKNKGAEGADANGYIWVQATYKATQANATVSTPSARVRRIIIGDPAQGIEDVVAGGKAVKVFENGNLVIIKNGVRYNALGAQL